jgi:hypothetical protein
MIDKRDPLAYNILKAICLIPLLPFIALILILKGNIYNY